MNEHAYLSGVDAGDVAVNAGSVKLYTLRCV